MKQQYILKIGKVNKLFPEGTKMADAIDYSAYISGATEHATELGIITERTIVDGDHVSMERVVGKVKDGECVW